MGANGGFSFSEGTSPPPIPPVDIPVPPYMPPDMYKIIIGAMAAGEASQLDPGGLPKWLAWIPAVIKWIILSFLGMLLKFITGLLQVVFEVFNSVDPSMNLLAATAVAGMTGLTTGAENVGIVQQRASRTPMAVGISTLFSQAMQQIAPAGPNGTLAPSDKGANKFLEMAAHMAIEGWMQGWILELCTWDKAERFADLKDTLEASLGIGRLSHRAMAAPMKVFAEDPYVALLNQTYHPSRLQPAEAVRYYLRGNTDRAGLQALMDLDGYPSNYVDSMIADQLKLPEPGEIFLLLEHGDIQQTDAITMLKHQGYDDQGAAYKLGALRYTHNDGLQRELIRGHMELFKAKKLDTAMMVQIIDQSELPFDERSMLKQLVTNIDLGRMTPLTIGEGETLYKKGIWSEAEFDALAQWHDYTIQDRTALETLLAQEIIDEGVRAQNQALWAGRREAAFQRSEKDRADRLLRAQQQVEAKGVGRGEYETLVEEGLRTLPQYTAYLISKQVAVDNALALTAALQTKIIQQAAAAAKKAAAATKAKIKEPDIAQLETAVKQGLMTNTDFQARLVQLGMSAADAQLLGQELQGTMTTAATKAQTVAAAKAAAAVKQVDLSQEERAVRLGNQTIDQYQALLKSKGFDAESISTLVSNLNSLLAADKQTAAKKAAAAAKVTTKGITIAQLEKLVRAGTEPISSYTAALATAGYDAADQQALTQYLQLQMDQDQQDLILHGHAAALVDQMGVSLADLERAVKLSVVPISTYQDALNRAGVSPQDQTTLVNTLAAQIKTTRAAQTTLQSVSKTVAAAGVSLATIEKDTVSGKISIQQFQALLAGYGVSAADQSDVVQLVQDEIDNAAAVKALVAGATAKAAAKGLDLAQITAAYKQNVLDETTWRADVAGLGYDAADVEILFETLAATQAAAAAKSATKTTTPATTTATPAA